jgi:hypothetical protein
MEKEDFMRLTSHPILDFKREEAFDFTFEGTVLVGYPGETIAAALHANDIMILSHSARAHEPRGLYCAIGNCSSCLMVVNDIPNVRVCVEPLMPGDRVELQEGKGNII